MKKFLLKTLLAFSLIFIFLFTITMFLEHKNKQALQSKVNVEVQMKDGDIVVPDEPAKVTANYEFSKMYFFIGLTIGIAVPLLFYCYDGVEVIKKCKIKYKWLEGGAIFIMYTLFSEILLFPKVLFSAFYRARLVGLSNKTFVTFFKDYLASTSFDILVSLPIVILIYIAFIKQKRWYFIASGILIVVSIVSNFIYPYIDEAQNNLIPMEECELKDKIKNLALEAGINDLDIMVIPKSEKTSSMNAYMTGINKSKRIVLWDTTLNQLNDTEVLSVVAHEIGHYKMNHIPKQMLISALTTILSLLLIHNVMKRIKGENYRGIDNIPQLLFLINIVTLLLAPLDSAYSRKMEVEADVFAMELTKDGYTNGALEVKFINSNLTPVNPTGLYKWLAYDHPTVKERIELSNEFSIK